MKCATLLCGVFLLLILAGLASAADQTNCQLVRYSEIPITTLPDGRFTVPVALEGQPLNFLVDTGGTIAMVSPEQAHNLRLNIKMTDRYLEGVAGFVLYNYAD